MSDSLTTQETVNAGLNSTPEVFSCMIETQLSAQSSSSARAVPPSQWPGPLFVVGLWRSGTSLLYTLLNKHPQIALIFEGDLFLLKSLFWIPRSGSSRLERWDFRSGAVKRHGLDVGRIASSASRLQTTMQTVYQEYAHQNGATIGGEKSPLYYHSLVRLARDFPNARFIIIWRDPVAMLGSVIRNGANEPGSFFEQRGMTCRSLMGYKALKVQCDRLIKRGAPVHQIQYETLVNDPASTMAQVCEFLSVPFLPSVASLHGANRSAISDAQCHSLVKSERIVSSLERPEVLPVDLKEKVERYVSLWREETGGTWPQLPASQTLSHRKPSLRERVLDRCGYAFFRTLDSIKLVVYCYAPLGFLRARQAFKEWRRAAAAKASLASKVK